MREAFVLRDQGPNLPYWSGSHYLNPLIDTVYIKE